MERSLRKDAFTFTWGKGKTIPRRVDIGVQIAIYSQTI